MKFPGSKPLYQLDLALHATPLDDLLRSCQQVGLTGFAELKTPDGVGMIFYYLGSEANALFREGEKTFHGGEALDHLKKRVESGAGAFSVYELPLDMAHLLRGITNRRKLSDPLGCAADLAALLERLEVSQHTGTLELQTTEGAAMLLMIGGRVSNTYWETSAGLTFEKGEARQRLERSLPKHKATGFLSDFSQIVWKSRHEVESTVRSRLEPTSGPPPTVELAAEEDAARVETLERLVDQVPALMLGFMFDLMTGAVLARRGRGTAALRVSPLAERVPGLTIHLRDLVAASLGDDLVETLELETTHTSTVVAVIAEAQEAIVVIADKSQPTSLIGSALQRAGRAYAAGLSPARGGAAR